MAAAISSDGEMYFEIYPGGTNGERYKEFLEHLNNVDDRVKFVIHDGLPSHRAKLVTEYVQTTNGKLKLFQLYLHTLLINKLQGCLLVLQI